MRVLRELAVVVPLLIGTLAIALSFSAVPNITIQKACSPRNQPSINDFICNDTVIIAQVSKLASTRSTVKTACSALSTALLGYWRDFTGLSRPLMVIGSIGEMISAAGYLLAAVDWGSTPWIPAMIEAVVAGLFGEGVLILGANCIVIAKSSAEERTMRIQIYVTCSFVAALIASTASGFFLTYVGYKWLFATVMILQFISLLCVLVFVEEAPRDEVLGGRISLKDVFKPRPNVTVIWLMLFCGALVNSIFSAENSLSLYFFQQRYHFTIREGTIYGTYHFIVSIVGSFLMAVLLTKVLKWSDFKFGIASSFLTALASVSSALTTTRTLFVLCAPLSIMRLNLYTIPQSVLSKCIREDELGVFIGIGSIVGICIPFCLNYLYSYTFSATSKTMPGAFYFISATGYLFIVILFSVSWYLYRQPENAVDCSGDCETLAADAEDRENLISTENSLVHFED